MLYLILFLPVCVYLAVEKIRHKRRLRRIPIRIHVNGTRGKSNVTRLITTALRRSGIRTLGKTTGTLPRLILPDGSEKIIDRWAPPNILEQIRTIKAADALKVEAVVIECMALDPLLQYVSEREMIRSTVGVITNVRPDHFEVMGEQMDDIAESLSQSIPRNGILVTGDSRYHAYFAEAASQKGTRTVLAVPESDDTVEIVQQHVFFRENIAIVEAVLAAVGLDRSFVSSGMDDLTTVAESAAVMQLCRAGTQVHFIDAFSANDTDSTKQIQEKILAVFALPRPRVALFNNRADRPLRMKDFAQTLLPSSDYDCIVVIGENVGLARKCLREVIPEERILTFPGREPDDALPELLRKMSVPEVTIIGMGNEKGQGRIWREYFEEASSR